MSIDTPIKKGLLYLSKTQKPNGEFKTYTSDSIKNFQKSVQIESTFPTSNILHSLSYFKEENLAKKIIKKSTKFLLKEFHPDLGTINYWPRKSSEIKELPIPDDLDASVVAYSGLIEIGVDGGEEMFPIMVEREDKEGGPYRTWVVPKNIIGWQDVELGVNANILFFCGLKKIYLPNLIKYIYEELKSKRLNSLYYPGYTNLYLISRAYREGRLKKLEEERSKEEKIKISVEKIKELSIKYILEDQKKIRSSLQDILNLTTLINFEYSDREVLQDLHVRIIKSQKKDGSWEAAGFNYGHNKITKGKQSYDGSPELTTALALEALNKFDSLDNKETDFIYPKYEKRFNEIKKRVKIWVSEQKPRVRIILLNFLNKLLLQNFTTNSALLPFFFYDSLSKDLQEKIDQNLLYDLGVNNVIGWGFYYLQDKDIDEGLEDKTMLRIMRDLGEYFLNFFKNRFPENKDLQEFLKTSNKEYINALKWELSNCRFDNRLIKRIPDFEDYGQLARRSIPFVYSTVALMSSLGISIESNEIQNIIKAIRHYLIAKQLNDDAHDWEADLRFGHTNSVISLILDRKQNVEISDTFLEELNLYFWEKGVDKVVKLILKNLKQSKKYIEASGLKNSKIFNEIFLIPLERVAIKTIKERDAVLRIIKK